MPDPHHDDLLLRTVVRRLEFDAAHRIVGHEGRCAGLHGHRYVVEVEVVPAMAYGEGGLDGIGRVIDFGVVKSKVGGWIDAMWDHSTILQHGDPLAAAMQHDPHTKPYFLNDPPTAEVLAERLFELSIGLLTVDPVTVRSVTVWETPNCRATYRADPHKVRVFT